MAILITGGAGYIGSHVCVALLEAGYSIVVLDRSPSPPSMARVRDITGKDFPVYETDLLDAAGVEEVFSNHRDIEAVIHCAGLKSVGESVEQPLRYYDNNLTGTFILCETMGKFGVKKMVFSSSAVVYGNAQTVPITEDLAVQPMSPYGQTKAMTEQILTDLCASDPAWSVSLLRYFNPLGAHPSGMIGEDPRGTPSNLVPYITQVAIGKLEAVRVFGDDYDTPDGTGVRDYIHVSDLADGHVLALDRLREVKGVETFNLATGRGYSVLEVIHSFEEASGVHIPYMVVDRRPGDIATSYADPSKAERILGWKATRGLLDMCRDSWRWQKKNPRGYQE